LYLEPIICRICVFKVVVLETLCISVPKIDMGTDAFWPQVLDQTNPLTQIVHGRKLSYLGPGGLMERTASFQGWLWWIPNSTSSTYESCFHRKKFPIMVEQKALNLIPFVPLRKLIPSFNISWSTQF